jgi:hypothetical protein
MLSCYESVTLKSSAYSAALIFGNDVADPAQPKQSRTYCVLPKSVQSVPAGVIHSVTLVSNIGVRLWLQEYVSFPCRSVTSC